MPVFILPISLTTAAAAAILNFWLGLRIGQVRTREKISVGDGGSEPLIRRMRAQANFVEFTPFVLILIALIELATGTSVWLWAVAAIYIVGRVAHAIGMDGNMKARAVGTGITMLTMVGLALYGAWIAHASDGRISAPVEDVVPAA